MLAGCERLVHCCQPQKACSCWQYPSKGQSRGPWSCGLVRQVVPAVPYCRAPAAPHDKGFTYQGQGFWSLPMTHAVNMTFDSHYSTPRKAVRLGPGSCAHCLLCNWPPDTCNSSSNGCHGAVCCCYAGGLARALQGVKSVIALGRLGALLPAAQRAQVERVVLLSTAGGGALGQALHLQECNVWLWTQGTLVHTGWLPRCS